MAEKKISTEAEALAYLREDNGVLHKVPGKLRTISVCRAALTKPWSIKDIPADIIAEVITDDTIDGLIAGVRNNLSEIQMEDWQEAGELVHYVPEDYREQVEEAISDTFGFDGGSSEQWAAYGNEQLEEGEPEGALWAFEIALERDMGCEEAREGIERAKTAIAGDAGGNITTEKEAMAAVKVRRCRTAVRCRRTARR